MNWAMLFFILSLIAAVFGFSGINTPSTIGIQNCFYFFAILFVMAMLAKVFSTDDKKN